MGCIARKDDISSQFPVLGSQLCGGLNRSDQPVQDSAEFRSFVKQLLSMFRREVVEFLRNQQLGFDFD